MTITLDGTNGITTPDVEPSGSTVPTNGIYLPTTNTVGLATDSTERVRVDSSGNVGIGTSSPAGPLDVAGNDGITVRRAGQTNGFLFRPTATGDGVRFTQEGTGDRMTIDSSGNLLVGTTDSSIVGGVVGSYSRFKVSGSAGSFQIGNTGNEIAFSRNSANYISATAGTSSSIQVKAGSSAGGVSLSNGATSWASASDERIKTTLTPFQDAIAKVCTLRSGTGRYLEDEENVSRSFLLAQDVQAVLPEAVDAKDDDIGTLTLRYTDTIPLLVAAIKEQQAMIQEQAATIESLTARITALEQA